MLYKGRRNFLINLGKAAGVGLLSFIPGSFFNNGKFLAAQTKTTEFESILRKTNRTNLYKVLESAKLNSEEKLAIVAVREMNRDDLKMLLSEKRPSVAAGGICGAGCEGSSGTVCGMGCSVIPNAIGVVDKEGKLGIKLKSLSKSTFKLATQKALKLLDVK